MRNRLTANIVKLDLATSIWIATTIAYDGVHTNGCLLIWDDAMGGHVEYRPAEVGSLAQCQLTAKRWNRSL